MQEQLNEAHQQKLRLVSDYENIIQMKNQRTKTLVEDYEARLQDLGDQVKEEAKFGEVWMGRFMQLAWLANNAIADIPHMLRRAEMAINPLQTPVEIKDLVDYCKNYFEKMKYVIARRS